MEIRPAHISDVPDIFLCCVKAFGDYIPCLRHTPPAMLEDYCLAQQRDHLFVAVDDADGLRGFLLIRDGKEDSMWLQVLATYPKGRGIGRQLLTFGENFIRKQGKHHCLLYTNVLYNDTIEFFIHCGYDIYTHIQEHGFDRYYMRKILPDKDRPGGRSARGRPRHLPE